MMTAAADHSIQGCFRPFSLIVGTHLVILGHGEGRKAKRGNHGFDNEVNDGGGGAPIACMPACLPGGGSFRGPFMPAALQAGTLSGCEKCGSSFDI